MLLKSSLSFRRVDVRLEHDDLTESQCDTRESAAATMRIM